MFYPELRKFSSVLLFLIAFSASAQEPTDAVHELSDYTKVAGTFHFVSPTENMHVWPVSFIEELYPEIEAKRLESDVYYWEYSNDMTIVIYSRHYVNSDEFIPLPSPYNGPNKL